MDSQKHINAVNKLADDIKQKVGIVEHISKYEQLTQSGDKWIGPHSKHSSESSNSNCLQVNSQTGLFNCFACDDGGDIISFEAQRQDISNFDAMKYLANEYNIPLPDFSDYNNLSDEERELEKQRIDQESRVAKIQRDFSQRCINNLGGEPLKYLENRGLTPESIEKYQIGYCPKTLDGFVKKYEKSDLLASGLFNDYNGDLKPALAERIIIPHLKNNRPMYFTGRSIDKSLEPVYKAQKSTDLSINSYAVERGFIQCGNFTDKKPSGIRYKDIFIAEGTFDCLVAAQEFGQNFVVLSSNSCNLSQSQLNSLAESLCRTHSNRKIVFCFDNDKNRAGQKGAYQMAKKFHSIIRRHLINRYGESNRMSEKEISEMVSQPGIPAQIVSDMPQIHIAIIRRSPESETVDVADYIQGNRVSELKYWIESSLTISQYQLYLDDDQSRFRVGQRGGISSHAICNEIEREGNFYINTEKDFYRYEKGQYVKDRNRLDCLIENKCQEVEERHTRGILTKIKRRNPFPFELTIPQEGVNKICVKNGWIHFSRQDLENNNGKPILTPHSPYDVTTVQLDCIYDPDAECPKFSEFMTQILPNTPDRIEIGKWLFYSLVPDAKEQKALFCIGAGSNGKGTLFRVWQSILGEENYSGLSLEELGEERFAKVNLHGSLANFVPEIDQGEMNKAIRIFKQITGEDKVDADQKFKDILKFKVLSKMIFSANDLPYIYDRSFGMQRRWFYVKFTERFEGENMNINLSDELTTEEEKSGILNYILWHGLDFYHDGFTQSELGDELQEEHLLNNDRFYRFFKQYLVVSDIEEKILSTDLYELFQMFEKVHYKNERFHSQTRLNKEIKRLADIQNVYVEKKQDGSNGSRSTWFGLTVNIDASEALTEEYDVLRNVSNDQQVDQTSDDGVPL